MRGVCVNMCVVHGEGCEGCVVKKYVVHGEDVRVCGEDVCSEW